MKTIRLSLLSLLVAVSVHGAGVPYAITQLASNATTSSMVVRGSAFPNGTNSFYWFASGFASTVLNTTGGVTSIGSGTITQAVNSTLSGLLAGTRYYYQLIVSNDLGVAFGTIENAVTTQVIYQFTGTGWQNYDSSRPYDSEPGSVWDDVARDLAQSAISANNQTHDIYGNLLPGIVATTNLADGAVTAAKLGAGVAASFTGGVVNAVVTNALVYLGGSEADGVVYQLTGQALKNIGSTTIASNTFRNIMVDAGVLLINDAGNRRDFIVQIQAAGVTQKEFIQQFFAGTHLETHVSVMFTGAQTTATAINILVAGGQTTANQTAQLKYIRAWGRP